MDPNMQGQMNLFTLATTLCFAAAVFCAAMIVVTTLRALLLQGTPKAAGWLKTVWLPIFIGLTILTCAAYYAAHHPLS